MLDDPLFIRKLFSNVFQFLLMFCWAEEVGTKKMPDENYKAQQRVQAV